MLKFQHWLKPTPIGLYCEPGQFYIDPIRPVDFAIVTHGHGDHAPAGHHHVITTPATHAIMQVRYGQNYSYHKQALNYHETLVHRGMSITLLPAGHILGSAQVRLDYQGQRIIVSGDYKRRYDPTCDAFMPQHCDLFITEATFGLPVFKHPPISEELNRLLASLREFPDRCHVVGVYALGKAQRLIASLRQLDYERPIYIHSTLGPLCELYQLLGIKLPEIYPVTAIDKQQLRGEIVLTAPGNLSNGWAQAMPDALIALASGWMRIRARSRQRQVELPLIISDHADWDELNQTIDEIQPQEVWVTHGREDALVHACCTHGIPARPLQELLYKF